jgi:hypothetical protein
VSKEQQGRVDKLAEARLPSFHGRRLADVPIEHLSAAIAQEAAGVLFGHCRPQTMNRAGLMPFAAAGSAARTAGS